MSNLPEYERDYLEIKKLGEGTFGRVHEVKNQNQNVVTAMKIIELKDITGSSIKYIDREIKILSEYKSPYVVEYIRSFYNEERSKMHIEMELCPISLKAIITNSKKDMDVKFLSQNAEGYFVCCELFVQILRGVDYLHKNNIIHRDLKPSNILIKKQKLISVKLADFGLSRIKDFDGKSMTAYQGTRGRMAPELYSNNDILKVVYDHKVDIYSLGYIINDLFGSTDIRSINNTLNNKMKNLNDIKKSLFLHDYKMRPECYSIIETKNNWALNYEELKKNENIQLKLRDKEFKSSLNQNFVFYYLRNITGLEEIGYINENSSERIVNMNNEIPILLNYSKFTKSFSDHLPISSGSYGVVFKCRETTSKQMCAIKRIELSYHNLSDERYLEEAKMMKHLKSEHIVEYYDTWIEKDDQKHFLFISMELCLKTLKDLNQIILEEIDSMDTTCGNSIYIYIICHIIRQITDAIHFLHKNKIIHRDLKPENILIQESSNGKIIRIADFGISAFHSNESNMLASISHTGDVGDIRYMAPELGKWSDRESGRLVYDNKVDIYSFGVTCEELNINKIAQRIFTTPCRFSENFENLIAIIDIMKAKDPISRPNCNQILIQLKKCLINVKDLLLVHEVEYLLRYENKKSINFCATFLKNELKRISKKLVDLQNDGLCDYDDLVEKIKTLI